MPVPQLPLFAAWGESRAPSGPYFGGSERK